MDFGPYGRSTKLMELMSYPSSDVPEMVDRKNLWNSLVISTYLLYLE
jgi:hypothetical protein